MSAKRISQREARDWKRRAIAAALAAGGEAIRYSVTPRDQMHEPVLVEYRGKGKWAITNGSDGVMNRDGEWEWEPQPSSRDDAFLARCRYDSAEEAMKVAGADLTNISSGGVGP